MNKALKRNKCRYKETGMYLRMLDRKMQPIKDLLMLDTYMANFDLYDDKETLFVHGQMGGILAKRVLNHD